jgi:hypothetical protein
MGLTKKLFARCTQNVSKQEPPESRTNGGQQGFFRTNLNYVHMIVSFVKLGFTYNPKVVVRCDERPSGTYNYLRFCMVDGK